MRTSNKVSMLAILLAMVAFSGAAMADGEVSTDIDEQEAIETTVEQNVDAPKKQYDLFAKSTSSAAVVAARVLGLDLLTGSEEANAFANCNCAGYVVMRNIACTGAPGSAAACSDAEATLAACEEHVTNYCDLQVMN